MALTSSITSFFFFFFLCVVLQLCIRHAQASQIAAYWNGGFKAPQVIMYDSASDSILYSLCNSKDTPIFPGDKLAAFPLQARFPPLPGTHVSVIGYEDRGIKAKDGHIVEALFTCNDTGYYEPVEGEGAYKLTTDRGIAMPKSPTDMTALLLGEEGGYRLHYKEAQNSSIYSIKYEPKEKGGWVSAGASEPYSSVGNIAAGFAVPERITVVTPQSDRLGGYGNMFVSTALPDEDGIWQIDAVPVPLHAVNMSDSKTTIPVVLSNMTNSNELDIAYDDKADPTWTFEALDFMNAPLALTFGSSRAMSVFYVGKDKLLRQVRREEADNDKTGYKWSNVTRPNAKQWPLPDATNAHFGAAYDRQSDRVWLYYMSNLTLTQLYQPAKDQWHDAVALPKSHPTSIGSKDGGGLSQGAKLGIGIGVGLGVPLLLAAVAAYLFFHSRRSRRNRAAENAAMQDAHSAAVAPPSHPGSPAPRYTSGYWPPVPGQQPHNGAWIPQQHLGVPYSDQNGYIKPELGYGWGTGGLEEQALQQQQQQQFVGQMPHHPPPAQTQPIEMGNNQVPVPAQEMAGDTTTANQTPKSPSQVPSPHPT
ncbi:hypothetical protein PG993_002254 [Apiospora rasikravindrae]|uniref:Uncharacterized protein n=1 Tax=Apiospora rasikravindrae TaxID=990691 RepID=A0ABR1TYX1_9PEZI